MSEKAPHKVPGGKPKNAHTQEAADGMALQHYHADGTPFTAEEMAALEAGQREAEQQAAKLGALPPDAFEAHQAERAAARKAEEAKAKAERQAEKERRKIEMMRQGYMF